MNNNRKINLMSIKTLLAEAPAPAARREYPALTEGTYHAHVVDTGYVPNQKDASIKQAMIKVQIDGGEQNGRWVNLYLYPTKDEQFARNLRPWVSILTDAGIQQDQILDENSDVDDICLNVTTVITRALRRGVVIPLEVRLKPDRRKPGEFFKNPMPLTPAAAPIASEPANAAQLAAFAAASAAPTVPAAQVAEGF